MHSDHFEEEKLGKPYDIKMLRRVWPFVRPHRLWLVCSCFLIIVITGVDLSVPYITKIAIDRYIVPQENAARNGNMEPGDQAQHSKVRYLRADMTDPDIADVVSRHPDLFGIQGIHAQIAFDDLAKLEEKAVTTLRKDHLAGVSLAAGLFFAAISVSFVLNFMQTMIMAYTAQKVMYQLRIDLFSHIQRLSVSFFTHNPVGRLVTRVTNDVQNMQEVFGSIIVFIFKDLLLIIGVTVILLGINLKLTLISFSLLPLIIYGSAVFARRGREAFRILRVKVAEINTRFSETIGGIKIIRIFRQEMRNYRNFERLNHEHHLAGMAQVRVFAVFLRFMGFSDVFVVAVVIFYGGLEVLAGEISLGELVAFVAYMKMFFSPIRDIAQKYNVMQSAMASAERILLLLDNKERLPAPIAPCPSLRTIETIELAHVSFAYIPGETVLKGISFTIHTGETVAVVGPTGSGKTSLINLIIRFYDPSAGQVLINGRDIRESDIFDLRSRMALVTQDPFLFSGTLGENIFPKGSGDEDVERILAASNCTSLIDRLPDGLETQLSEGGASVSSGERQLISIARAVARDPELIILDEATSYIDSETEAKIQDALTNLMRNRTSLIVAHRLSTTRHADRIMVLHNGEIIESGTYQELISLKGFYFKLSQL